MAIVKLPALSIGAQGNLSEDIYYRKRGSSTVACAKVTPSNPQSDAQQLNRLPFRTIPARWRFNKAFPADVAAWEARRVANRSGGSAYNEYCRLHKLAWPLTPSITYVRNLVFSSVVIDSGADYSLRVNMGLDWSAYGPSFFCIALSTGYPNVFHEEPCPSGPFADWVHQDYEFYSALPWPTNCADIFCTFPQGAGGWSICYSGLYRFRSLITV